MSGVLDRVRQIDPKVIFSVEAVSYNMKIHDHLGKLRQVVKGIGSSLQKVIVVPFCTQNPESIEVVQEDKEIRLDQFLQMAETNAQLTFVQVTLLGIMSKSILTIQSLRPTGIFDFGSGFVNRQSK